MNKNVSTYVCSFIAAQSKCFEEFRGLPETLMVMSPTTPFSGEPVSVTREMNDEEIYREQLLKRNERLAERVRLIAERESRSVIPINQAYETSIFTC